LESLILIYKLLKHNILGLERIRPRDNETVTQWLGKHFGKFLDDKLFAPALLGIYASRTQDLSASLVFQSFFKGKVNKSPKQRWQRPSVRGTVAPQMGMGELIDGLEKRARELGVVIHLGKTYEWEKWANGRVPHVLATSVSEAVETLRARFPDLADQLGQIQTLPVVSATVFYPQGSSFLHGFGCLFSESEKMNALGVLFPGDLFANRSKEHVETWILGGSLHGEFVHWNENRILEAIATDREKLSGRRDVPMESHIYFWDKALPLYNVELCQILKKLELPRGLWLQGNYLGKIGIAGLIERSLDLPHRIREQGALEDSEQE
jgi:protoporphyrinogen oxidase